MTPKEMRNAKIDKMHTVAEEFHLMMGVKAEVIETKLVKQEHILIQTVAGPIKYNCSEDSVMGDVYRMVHHYGSKLANWGLKNKKNVKPCKK